MFSKKNAPPTRRLSLMVSCCCIPLLGGTAGCSHVDVRSDPPEPVESTADRITNATEITSAELPAAGLAVLQQNGDVINCSGVLIASDLVLTAAECVVCAASGTSATALFTTDVIVIGFTS